jgi:hypothetical protein
MRYFAGLFTASSTHSRAEQQSAFLVERQNQFRQAAMSAKTSGDIELAKKYLRQAKVRFVLETICVRQKKA